MRTCVYGRYAPVIDYFISSLNFQQISSFGKNTTTVTLRRKKHRSVRGSNDEEFDV